MTVAVRVTSLLLEAGPINDHPNGSWLFCFTFVELLYAKGLRNVSTN